MKFTISASSRQVGINFDRLQFHEGTRRRNNWFGVFLFDIYHLDPKKVPGTFNSLWESGYVESFNARMRDELLDGEIFLTLAETEYVVDRWRMDYNHYRPHSSLAYMTPAEFARLCIETDCRRTQRKQLDMSIKYGVEKKEILS